MKNEKISTVVLILTVIFFAGCSDNSISESQEQPQPGISIYPEDNTSGVRLDEKIVLNFNNAINRQIVERNFHLISEKNMADSSCLYGQDMMHGNMNISMTDTSKMNHLMNYHSTPGNFQWNSDSSSCTFSPDSLLQPGMNYMMHFGDEMINMMKEKMGSKMDGMNGMGTSSMTGHMMLHFTTMDTTSLGNAHNGHH